MKTIKFSGKLTIDKKTVAQLTDAQLESIQGGHLAAAASSNGSNSCNSCINCKTK